MKDVAFVIVVMYLALMAMSLASSAWVNCLIQK